MSAIEVYPPCAYISSPYQWCCQARRCYYGAVNKGLSQLEGYPDEWPMIPRTSISIPKTIMQLPKGKEALTSLFLLRPIVYFYLTSFIESISVTPSLGTALDSARRSAGPTRSLLLGIVSSLNDMHPNPADTDSLQLDAMSGAIGKVHEMLSKIYSDHLAVSFLDSLKARARESRDGKSKHSLLEIDRCIQVILSLNSQSQPHAMDWLDAIASSKLLRMRNTALCYAL